MISSKEKNSSTFNFFIISDTHENLDSLHKIVKKVLDSKEKFDYVLCAGDIVTVPNGKNDDPEYEEKYTKIVNELVNELEQIAPVLWVPGNHDPGNSFKEEGKVSFKGTNLHKSLFKLSDDLIILGLGGNPPILDGGCYCPGYVPFSTLDYDKFKYAGYPYNASPDSYEKSDELYAKDLDFMIKKAKVEYGDNVQMILLTHCGPSYTSTTLLVEEMRVFYMGSNNLGIRFEGENFFLNVHGHTHSGKGLVNLPNEKQVINPGAATYGYYGRAKIEKNSLGKWYLVEGSLDNV